MSGYHPSYTIPSLESLTLDHVLHHASSPIRSFHRPEDDIEPQFSGTGGTPSPSPPPGPFLSGSGVGSHDMPSHMRRDPRMRSDDTPFVPLASDGTPAPFLIAPTHEGYEYHDSPNSPREFGTPLEGAYDSHGNPVIQHRSRYGPPGRQHEWEPSSDDRSVHAPYPSRSATYPPGSPYLFPESPSPHPGASYHSSPASQESLQGVDPREIQGQDIDEDEMYFRRRLRMPAPIPLCLDSLPDPAPGAKPPVTYNTLAILAIYGSPEKKLSQRDICAAIMERYPWFKEHERTVQWKSSIRHMLSFQAIFCRHRRPVTQPGKGGLWGLDLRTNPDGLKRGRKRKPKTDTKGKKDYAPASEPDDDADDDDDDDESDLSTESSSPETGQMEELPSQSSLAPEVYRSRTWGPMTRRPESGHAMSLRPRDRVGTNAAASTSGSSGQGRGERQAHPSFGQPGVSGRGAVPPSLPSSSDVPPQFASTSGRGYARFGPPPSGRFPAGEASGASSGPSARASTSQYASSASASASQYASSASASARKKGKGKRSD